MTARYRQGEGRPRLVTFEREPVVGSGSVPLGLAERGGRDQAAALLEARPPEARAGQLVVARVVHRLGLDRLAGPLRHLRQQEPPVHRDQFPRAVIAQPHNRRIVARIDRRLRREIAQQVVGRAHVEQLAHRLLGGGVGIEVAHAPMIGAPRKGGNRTCFWPDALYGSNLVDDLEGNSCHTFPPTGCTFHHLDRDCVKGQFIDAVLFKCCE